MKLNLPLKYFISKLYLPHHSFEAHVIPILQNKAGILGVLQGPKGNKVRAPNNQSTWPVLST